ncbi:MAG: replication-relaxation family protein, partial [Thermoleophilaceae bacterium]
GAGALAPLALAPVGAVLGVSRALARRRRRYVRLTIVPSRDEATPARVQDLYEALHQRLEERWYRRLPLGQPSVTLEARSMPDGDGPCELRLELVCPQAIAATVEGAVRAPYPDARVEASEEAPEALPALLKLAKRHLFIRRLRTPQDYEPPPIDGVLSQLAGLSAPAGLQYVLTPVPALFDRIARRLFEAEEKRLGRKQRGHSGHPGLHSELAGRELEGGLALQHNRLFFAEIRVGAQSRAEARDLASAVQARSGAENQLVERRMLAFRRRVASAVGDIVPDARRGVVSSAELAGLWQLPSPGLTGVSLRRGATPRALAGPELSREPAHAVVRDEQGPVGLRPEERFAGVAITGAQGTGKSSVELRFVANDARCAEKAVVVLDPKWDLAEEALGVIPSDRVVHYLDPLEPEFGFNPLLAPGHPATIADNMVGAVKDLYEEGDLHASSERFIYEATMAIVGAHRLGALGATPSFWHLARMLHLEQRDFWERIARALEADPAYLETSLYFGQTLPAQLDAARSAFAQRLEAPSNKLQVLLSGHLDRVFRHPRALSLDEVVANREVLVVNGRMGDFGARNTRMLMQVILNSLYGALRRQQELPQPERVKVVLIVDEAHLILNPRFAEALATLRSAGLEVVAAWQYGEQVQDPLIRAGLMNLLGNRFVFRTSETEEARELSRLMAATYSDQVRADPDTRARVRFAPDTLFALPDHRTACTLIARGQRRGTFIGETFAMRSEPAVRAQHLVAQRERGGFVPLELEHPFDDWRGDGGAPASGRGPSAHVTSVGSDGHSAEHEDEATGHAEAETTSAEPASDGRSSSAGSSRRPREAKPTPRSVSADRRSPSPSALEILEEHRRLYGGDGRAQTTSPRRSPNGDVARPRPRPLLWGDEDRRPPDERPPEREGQNAEGRERPQKRERREAEPANASGQETEAASPSGSHVEVLRRRVVELERELAGRTEAEPPPSERPTPSEGGGADLPSDGGAPGTETDTPTRTHTHARQGSTSARGEQLDVGRLGSAGGAAVPESYTELDFNDPYDLEWEPLTDQPRRLEPKREHLEALAALHRLRIAYGSQLRRLGWPRAGDTVHKRLLRELAGAGWVDRGFIRQKGAGGRPKRFYALTKAGFAVVEGRPGPRGPRIRRGASWKSMDAEGYRTAIHDLHVAGWLIAFHQLAGRFVLDWHGEQHGQVAPERLVGDKWRRIGPDDVELELHRGVRNLKLDTFQSIKPDLTIELRLPTEAPRRLDLLVELDRSRDPTTDHNVRKFHRHDALLTAWWRAHPRYRGHGEAPIVVFVLEDEPTARKFVRRADSEVTGAIARVGAGRETWDYPGRRGMFFCCERDVHIGTLRAWRLPELPPEVRPKRGRRVEPEQVELIPRRLLG